VSAGVWAVLFCGYKYRVTRASASVEPALPKATGPLSAAVIESLTGTYLAYLGDVPAETLASVNLMSYFALHRSMRGAVIGHFASTETDTSKSNPAFSAETA
jgi:hypothetical protein